MRMRLADGTLWPTLRCAYDTEHVLRHGQPSRADLLHAAEICACYGHLLAHPVGTEKTIDKLRMLRRAAAKAIARWGVLAGDGAEPTPTVGEAEYLTAVERARVAELEVARLRKRVKAPK